MPFWFWSTTAAGWMPDWSMPTTISWNMRGSSGFGATCLSRENDGKTGLPSTTGTSSMQYWFSTTSERPALSRDWIWLR